ncbi:hypothetical protein C922_04682 [Plasmodium inui San Antonio 1]|uniref:Plasmodium RESA N-terminal domain-containing protein n=1 Tax=Plasmodium inui San Antonio 1 TaxID=1237626 RepID=W7A060_9APIC|nr:hypothetical protein C922_04682 [Plasmodium inui San Antonio 1]EUD64950.1 hypothetical protein C922_04682 [Plasmodium inui San Antonio 1]
MEVDNSMEMTNQQGNPGSRKGINRCDSSLFRILNIVFIGLLFLVVETTHFTTDGKTHEEADEWTEGKARRLACQDSFKEPPEERRPDRVGENENLFDSSVMGRNNLNDNSSQAMYGLPQRLCMYNDCFIKNRKKKGRSADFTNEGGSSVDIPCICWEDSTTTASSELTSQEAHDQVESRRSRFIQKGYFEYINHTQELSETEFIEKISTLGEYVDSEEMSSIFYYVHTNERKKYFAMQENVITHWENLSHNYNVKEEFKKEQMRSLYEETTNFFLFKERQFLKSFSTFVRFGKYKTKKFTDVLISYRRLCKEYRRMVSNFCSAKMDALLKTYWEENRDEALQMRIQY